MPNFYEFVDCVQTFLQHDSEPIGDFMDTVDSTQTDFQDNISHELHHDVPIEIDNSPEIDKPTQETVHTDNLTVQDIQFYTY